MNDIIKDILGGDEWEFDLIKCYKAGKIILDIDKVMKYLIEELAHCNSGAYIGIGYHGGSTQEDWIERRVYIETCIKTLDTNSLEM